MAETGLEFTGVVGWHRSQISFRLQQLMQGGGPDFAAAAEPGPPKPLNKILKIGDATRIEGGGFLFPGDAKNIKHWIIVELRGRTLPILKASIHSVISSDPDFERFVDDVYDKILGRQADLAGLEHYVSLLAAGALTPSSFVEIIASSSEAQERNRPLLIVAHPYESLDNMSQAMSAEQLIDTLSISVTDI